MVYKIRSVFPFNHRVYITAEITMEAGQWSEILEKMENSKEFGKLFSMLKETVGKKINILTVPATCKKTLDETNVQNPQPGD